MPLRVRPTGYTVNPDRTIDVTYDVLWLDDKGATVWQQTGTLRAPADSSRDAISQRHPAGRARAAGGVGRGRARGPRRQDLRV